MISVSAKTILHLKKIIGAETQIQLPESATLQTLLDAMAERWGDKLAAEIFQPGTTTPLPHIRLMVNGRDIAFLNRLDTPLRDADAVLILPPVAGG